MIALRHAFELRIFVTAGGDTNDDVTRVDNFTRYILKSAIVRATPNT